MLLAALVVVASAGVALLMPAYACRPGWRLYSGAGSFCGLPYDDDWGYAVNDAAPIRLAIAAVGIGLAAVILLERKRSLRAAAIAGIVSVSIILWPLLTWTSTTPSVGFGYQPEDVGRIAAGLRCPDDACDAQMSVEDAVTASPHRYPEAQRYWSLIVERLDHGGTPDRIRAYFANRFGDDVLL